VRWALLLTASCSFQPGALPGDAQSSTADTGDSGPGDGAVYSDGAPADWWNPAWKRRLRLSIEDSVALPMGFQVGFAIDLDAAPCSGSRDQVRIVHMMTELPRVIDEVGANEWIWFRLQAALPASTPTDAYWLYCGNPSAGAAPADPTTVFDVFDDFGGTALGASWTTTGSVTVAGGVVTLDDDDGFRTTATYPPNSATDFVMSTQTTSQTMWFWGGFQNNFTFTGPWMLWNATTATQIRPDEVDSSGSWTGTPQGLDTAFHLYGVENYGTSSMYRYQDMPVAQHTHDANISQSISVRFHNYMSVNTIQVGMMRVRKAANPPPTVTVSPVETLL